MKCACSSPLEEGWLGYQGVGKVDQALWLSYVQVLRSSPVDAYGERGGRGCFHLDPLLVDLLCSHLNWFQRFLWVALVEGRVDEVKVKHILDGGGGGWAASWEVTQASRGSFLAVCSRAKDVEAVVMVGYLSQGVSTSAIQEDGVERHIPRPQTMLDPYPVGWGPHPPM